MYRAVGVQVVVRPRDGRQGAVNHGATQDVVHLGDAGDDVVAEPGLVLVRIPQQDVDLLVDALIDIGFEHQESVDDELADLFVGEERCVGHAGIVAHLPT